MLLGGGTLRNLANAGKGRLADAELGFDARDAIVQFNDFADERIEPDFQPVESVIDSIESGLRSRLDVIESVIDAVESRFVAVESRVEAVIKDDVHQDTDQYREGRYADRQI